MQNSHKSVFIFILAAFMAMVLVGSGFAVWNFNANAQDEALNGHNVGVYVTSSSYQGDFETDGPTMLVLDVGVSNTSLTTGINFFKQVTSKNNSNKTEYHITNDLTIEFIPLFEDYATYNGTERNPTEINGYQVLQLKVDNAGETIKNPETNMNFTVPENVYYVDVLSMNLALSGPIAQILQLSDLYSNLVEGGRVSFGKLQNDTTFNTEFTAHCRTSVRENPETGTQKLVYSYKLVIKNVVLCLSYQESQKLTLDNYKDTIDLLATGDSALAFNFFVQEFNQA